MLSRAEVASHNTRSSCWVIIQDKAYDVTSFIDSHPGGGAAVLKYAGKDATEEYVPIHPSNALDKFLRPEQHLGPVEPNINDSSPIASVTQFQDQGIPLELCQNLSDIEVEATRVLSERAFTYFHSAADSLSAYKTNVKDWSRISFRPRVMRDVLDVDMSCNIMGHRSSLPFFIAPMAMIKFADDEGEKAFARAAGNKGIPYVMSTYSSVSHEEVMDVVKSEALPQTLVFQLYVPRNRKQGERLVCEARQLGFESLVVTVDTPVVGKREEDERYKARVQYQAGAADMPRTAEVLDPEQKPVLRGVHSSTLNWKDLVWIREAWQNAGPIFIKGIQTADDALIAYQHGVEGIYLSNHGGRQLDFAPSSLQTLMEIRKFYPELIGKLQIYLDGGVRRGTDILKAICLGATAVGLGRPFVYGLGAYGQKGIERVVELLSDEIETSMRLLGVTKLSELSPHYVNTKVLEHRIVDSIQSKSDKRFKAHL